MARSLFHNNQDGTFTDVTSLLGSWPSGHGSCAWADLDNDGWPDLIVSGSGSPVVFHNDQGKGFTQQTGLFPFSGDSGTVAVGDYDNDGWMDVAFSGPSNRSPSLFHNNHDGTFTDVTVSAGLIGRTSWGNPISWADYNNDGFLDLFVGGLGATPPPRSTATTATARSRMLGRRPVCRACRHMGAAVWGDLDVDGKIDLFIGGQPTSVLMHNIGPAANWLRVRALDERHR